MTMVIRDKVKQEIDRLPEGVVVSASDFDIPRQYRATLVKALNQFEHAGVIKRVSKGRYYKPRTSRFGELLPPEKEIVRDFLEKDGNTIGYITGTRDYPDIIGYHGRHECFPPPAVQRTIQNRFPVAAKPYNKRGHTAFNHFGCTPSDKGNSRLYDR